MVGVPRTAENLAVLGLPADTGKQSPWIIPPFPLLSDAFRKGGPFIRDGRVGTIPGGFDASKVAVGTSLYRPGLPGFVPKELNHEIPLDVDAVDHTDWKLFVWVSGSAIRPATEMERDFQLVPWTYYPLGFLDLWLKQYRCYHLDLDIPTELSPPDENIDHDAEETETPTGLKMRKVELDASTGELEGQHTVYVQVIVDSELDKAIAATGNEANGCFLEGVARYLQSADRIDPSLQLDPEGDGIGIYGNPAHVDKAQATLTKVAESPAEIAKLINQAEKAGIEFDD
ncbi:hypothetical protein [uncultured Corynebacterium sp.]|uniref:hypothetical protein n=1 Tax=uncultured Corynebacterium sp. TaxID=159447 RepID=UPI00259B3EC9|nr:hypothetical protein [uncultured Corynebacterium sp.]